MRIVSSLGVLHDCLCLVLKTLSVLHPLSFSNDGDTALSEVLKTVPLEFLKTIDSLTYPGNKEKIYDGGAVWPKITINALDTTLIFNILISIKGYPTCYKSSSTKKKKKGKSCKQTDNGHTGKCCMTCTHTCLKCMKGTECCKCCRMIGAKCNHNCHNGECAMLKYDCYKWSKICCNKCMTCGHCNAIKLVNEQCAIYKLKVAIADIHNIRNLFSHGLEFDVEPLKEGTFFHPKFPNCSKWESFCALMDKSLDYCLQFLSDTGHTKHMRLKQEVVDRMKNDLHVAEHQSIKEIEGHFNISCDEIWKYMQQIVKINEMQHKKTRKYVKRALKRNSLETNKQLNLILKHLETPTKKNKTMKELNYIDYDKRFHLVRKTTGGCVLSCVVDTPIQICKILISREWDDWTSITQNSYGIQGNKFYLDIQNLEIGYKYSFRVSLKEAGEFKEGISVIGFDDLEVVDGDKCHHVSHVDGVIVCAHNRGDGDDVHVFVGEVEDLQRADKIMCSFTPGANINRITLSEFQELGDKYLYRNSCKELKPYIEDVLRFPASYLVEKNDELLQVTNILEKHLEKYKSHFRAIISQYNDEHHLKYAGYTHKQLDEQGIYSRHHENRIVLLTSTLPAIVNVRIASGDLNEIQKAFSTTNIDLKSLLLTYKYLLKGKNIPLFGVVACPSLTRHQIDEFQFLCDACKRFVLTKDDLRDVATFKQWWLVTLEETVDSTLKQYDAPMTDNLNKLFFQITSQTVAVMATIRTDLPTLSANVNDQVTSIMLNKDQLEAIYGPGMKKIVKGSYGSGKSVVAKQIVKSIFSNSSVKTFLYYICGDPFTLLDYEMRRFADELHRDYSNSPVEIICKNITEMAGEYDLEDFTPYGLLHQLGEKHKETSGCRIHVVIDEYDGEYFRQGESSRLRTLFQFNDAFKNSYVVIMTRGLEKERTLHVGEKMHPHFSNCFQGTGMDIINLPSTMRFSNDIHQLLASAQHTIFKTKSRLYSVIDTNKDDIDVSTKSVDTVETFHPRRIEESNNLSANDSLNGEEINLYSENLCQNQNISPRSNFVTNTFTTAAIHSNATTPKAYPPPIKTNSRIKLDFDQVSHVVGVDESHSNAMTATVFNYIRGDCGHSLTGQKPTMYYFPMEFHDRGIIAFSMLSQVLHHECLNTSGKVVIICNDLRDNELVVNAFRVLMTRSDFTYVNYVPGLTGQVPTRKEKDAIVKKLHGHKKCVLITDNQGFRGLECETVVMTINPNEYYKRHFLAESVARSTSRLFMLVTSQEESRNKQGTFQSVIDAWVRDDLVRVRRVKTGIYSNISKRIEEECIVDLDLIVKESIQMQSTHSNAVGFALEDARRVHERFNAVAISIGSQLDDAAEELPQNVIDSIEAENKEDTFVALLNENPDIVNMFDRENKRTPLLWSAYHNRPKIVKTLLQRGCDVGVTDNLPLTSYHWCARNGYSGCLHMLLEHDRSYIDTLDGVSQTALILAAKHGQIDCVKLLLRYGANAQKKNVSSQTAYDVAGTRTLTHNKKAVEELLSSI